MDPHPPRNAPSLSLERRERATIDLSHPPRNAPSLSFEKCKTEIIDLCKNPKWRVQRRFDRSFILRQPCHESTGRSCRDRMKGWCLEKCTPRLTQAADMAVDLGRSRTDLTHMVDMMKATML